jgi:uncharacterized protein (DUF1800 family)
MNATVQYRPAGTLSPSTALAPYRGPWNDRLAAHLLRRAGFGGSPSDIARFAAMPVDRAVDALIHYPKDSGLPGAPDDLGDDYDALQRKVAELQRSGDDPDALREARAAVGRSRRRSLVSMQRWWLERMVRTPAPLQEKMTLFWHGHFTSSLTKGITPREMLDQNWLYRSNALGNVREIAIAITQDPAMLKFLDNARSFKEHPNENFARELMELYTLGIGNYSEADVREAARALTGNTVRGAAQGGGFTFALGRHDFGTKAVLGKSGQLDGKDVVEIIFRQPAASRFIAGKLLDFFVYNEPEPELVEGVAELLRRYDFQTSPVVSQLLRSNVFYSDRAYRALVKSPVEFVVGTHQLFGLNEVTDESLAALARMGQVLFDPPSVKGWDGGAAWLNSQTVLARENFADYLVTAQTMNRGDSWLLDGVPPSAAAASNKLVETILLGDASPASKAGLEGYLDGAGTSALGKLSVENYEERMRGAAYLTMAMPAYQLS